MAGIDNMLAQYIRKSLEDQLGKKTTSQIEQELDSWYQIDLDGAIRQFEKLDRVLVNMYGKGPARSLEKRFLKPIIQTNNMTNEDEDNPGNNVAITITEPELVQTILTIVEDESFREIFEVMEGDKSFENILQDADLEIARPSAYRKMEHLAKNGLIMETGYVTGQGSRKVKTYKKIFDAIDIQMNGGAISIVMAVDKNVFENSVILGTILS
ncbi:MAG: hypothetical protein GKS07_11200 [Nitrosopumilus sp.]|nr:MAG: hypothetical protein GKS07_11200 [Nitrosopumilus sp.]